MRSRWLLLVGCMSLVMVNAVYVEASSYNNSVEAVSSDSFASYDFVSPVVKAGRWDAWLGLDSVSDFTMSTSLSLPAGYSLTDIAPDGISAFFIDKEKIVSNVSCKVGLTRILTITGTVNSSYTPSDVKLEAVQVSFNDGTRFVQKDLSVNFQEILSGGASNDVANSDGGCNIVSVWAPLLLTPVLLGSKKRRT